mgnify:CR=1 FL=1
MITLLNLCVVSSKFVLTIDNSASKVYLIQLKLNNHTRYHKQINKDMITYQTNKVKSFDIIHYVKTATLNRFCFYDILYACFMSAACIFIQFSSCISSLCLRYYIFICLFACLQRNTCKNFSILSLKNGIILVTLNVFYV